MNFNIIILTDISFLAFIALITLTLLIVGLAAIISFLLREKYIDKNIKIEYWKILFQVFLGSVLGLIFYFIVANIFEMLHFPEIFLKWVRVICIATPMILMPFILNKKLTKNVKS